MTLDEALHYIHSVCWKGSVPGLERISALLDKMGHPERKLKFIHVTGTNGKGSTCAMLASMFTKAGYKTGLYTSPYLILFNERIQIDGVQIPDEEICEITEYIKPLADSIFEQPTEFEMVTALGFEYFARHNCERFHALKLPLLGNHQLHNAAVALTAATVMQQRGWHITDEQIREGLADVRWPGRFDVRRKDPLFIIDGGHNPQCIQALVKNIQDYLAGRPLTILTGVLADKDYNCMYRNVEPYAKEFITVTPGNPRALNAHDLAQYLSQFGKPVTACDAVADGVRLAVEHAGKDGVVLCYGSLYMIGEIEAGLQRL